MFAALDVASGVTISTCYRRHRHQEFLRFLNDIDPNLAGDFDVHLAMANYGTHKVARARAWLARHPRYQVHFTPTSGSWLNLVERLFAEVTERCVRRGSHTAIRSLEKSMLACLDNRNRDPKPFVWTASADLILGKVARLRKRISRSGHWMSCLEQQRSCRPRPGRNPRRQMIAGDALLPPRRRAGLSVASILKRI